MKAHELARRLLEQPDHDVKVCVDMSGVDHIPGTLVREPDNVGAVSHEAGGMTWIHCS